MMGMDRAVQNRMRRPRWPEMVRDSPRDGVVEGGDMMGSDDMC